MYNLCRALVNTVNQRNGFTWLYDYPINVTSRGDSDSDYCRRQFLVFSVNRTGKKDKAKGLVRPPFNICTYRVLQFFLPYLLVLQNCKTSRKVPKILWSSKTAVHVLELLIWPNFQTFSNYLDFVYKLRKGFAFVTTFFNVV